MNQDQVRERLQRLDNSVPDFTVVFTGKTSKRVDGLYKPDTCEILIHNKNFEEDNVLMYTAIHEFAHHVQFTSSDSPVASRVHSTGFWDIFHRLLFRAEEIGIYNNIFESDPAFSAITGRIREKFLSVNASLMKEFGELLFEARKLCHEKHASFEDYVDRVLQLPRSEARSLISIHRTGVNPAIGYENMKTVARIRDDDARRSAEEAFLEGKSPDMVRAEFRPRNIPDDKLGRLIEEKNRLERNLENLTVRLAKIEREIRDLGGR
ncbi:MAG TPA: hypothetical protein PK926_08800 [Spirochaetota bacterium]|nr:hypothetical protein [Spirochaetota bacterium]HPI88612.1 hypothetical protein [Spirochaetota bacterium]HPR48253.1 hypothetical protein [Spirochaetota bacterium]